MVSRTPCSKKKPWSVTAGITATSGLFDLVLQAKWAVSTFVPDTKKSVCQEAPLSLSCHMMSFCEWTMSCGGIITSRCHNGRASFLFFTSSSFLLLTVVFCWGWHLSGRVFWLRQTALVYIQCPLGVCILFIIHALFDYCCSKIARVVRIREWLPDWV